MQSTSQETTQVKTGSFQSPSNQQNRKNIDGSSKKTKSKFNKKHRKPQKSPAQQVGPVHAYVSKCCNAPAKKPKAFSPIAGSKDAKTGLGKWRCSACGKITKVSVGKPQAPEVSEVPNEKQ